MSTQDQYRLTKEVIRHTFRQSIEVRTEFGRLLFRRVDPASPAKWALSSMRDGDAALCAGKVTVIGLRAVIEGLEDDLREGHLLTSR